MKTIAIANQKGGTGKTTTAYNLGIALTQQGYRVLMVDFDPQGNLSCYCGIPPEQDLEQTITELLMKVAYEKPLSHRECVYQSRRTDDSAPQVDFIPSNLRLASFELAMGTIPDSEPELAEGQENQPEPLRQDEAGLLGTERAEPVRPDDAGGNAAAELPQDGAGRTADGRQDAARPDAESADARPQDEPAGLGADVQQPEAAGGGNDPSDAVRSITEEPAAAESEPSPSAFSLPEFPAELLPSLLKADTTSRASNADILSFFSKTPLLIDRLRYIANICADDTIDLRELGSEKKVALFVVTPDTTTAYNFLAAVMFQQCFQILVDIADHRPDKRLPRHLRFLLDEFPNIGMIPDFQILISTIRSRDIACTLIYQSLNQLKSQYKDDWATIYENCDSMIVLGAGGNPENLEFFSKALGKATIEVMNTSENKGSQGSYTKSYQALGRELMTPEEIRTMPRNWCLLMISGVAPFYSRKYNLKDHPNYHLVEAEGGKPFDYDRRAELSFADFISNVKDVKTVNLCAENNN